MSEIVLAIRLGPASEAPTEVAMKLAEQTGARITVAYVVTELQAVQVAAGQSGMDPAEERRRLLERAEAELGEFIDAHLESVPVAGRVLTGRVEDCLADVARELNARFLVVGTRGRGSLARLILGDTVHAILQRTPCPVIVVPVREAQG
jgi:nucleotide-binding universal stress UspA family protein